MKKGDLVNFEVKARVFKDAERDYVNPGIVLEEHVHRAYEDSFEVMWADGKITREYSCYLTIATRRNHDRVQ